MGTPGTRSLFCKLHPVEISDHLEPLLPGLIGVLGGRRPVLCTERRLSALLGPFLGELKAALNDPPLLTFPGGERRKTRHTKERLEDDLLDLGADRGSALVAVGGGVVSDMVGFTAATYMRGIPWVAVPTTLLGMVDAALGGKTAVDTPGGKNVIGAFHAPEGVFCSLAVLSTLPLRQLRSGLAECLKHGLFMDGAHFGWLSAQNLRGISRDAETLRELVSTSIALKCAVVDGDPQEATGGRNILNAGHTVGHALERLSGYRISHGEAVAAGLLWEAAAAVVQGHLAQADLAPVCAAFTGFGFVPSWEEHPPEEVFAAAGSDKKNRAGTVAYVPLGAIGRPAFPPPHTAELTLEALSSGRRLLERA